MNLYHLTSDTLRNLIPLTEKRDALLKTLRALETDIAAALTGTATALVETVAPPKTRIKASKRGSKHRAGRGQLKEQILALLKAADSKGLGVKEIADKLGVKAGNVYVWFGSTGKALTSKVAPGRYTVKKSPSKPEARKARPAKPVPSAKTVKRVAKKPKSAAAKPVKAKRNISPEARAKMAAAATARWEKHRAGKTGSKPAARHQKASKPAKKGVRIPAPE